MNKKGAGILFVDNNFIGLGLRGEKVPAPNLYGSVGGKLELNETNEQAAIRECFEETNIKVDIQDLILFDEFLEDNGFIYTTFLVKCNKTDILKQFIPTHEIISLKFFDVNELPDNCMINIDTLKKAVTC